MSASGSPPGVLASIQGWKRVWRADAARQTLTTQIGDCLAAHLEAGDVVLIEGTLGAGKTFLTRAICAGLGISEGVSSPSYALVHEHDGPRLRVAHVDLYRLDSSDEELESIGFRDLLDDQTVVVVEWPDRVPWLAEVATIHVRLEDAGPELRSITVSVPSDDVAASETLLRALRRLS